LTAAGWIVQDKRHLNLDLRQVDAAFFKTGRKDELASMARSMTPSACIWLMVWMTSRICMAGNLYHAASAVLSSSNVGKAVLAEQRQRAGQATAGVRGEKTRAFTARRFLAASNGPRQVIQLEGSHTGNGNEV
jgi:hypothetical protein